MTSWSRGPLSNPLPSILEKIPFSETLIDPSLLDDIRIILLGCGYHSISNSMIMILLMDMNKAGLVSLEQFTWPSTLGTAFIIKRNTNGQ